MKVYNYHPSTGEYLGASLADQDPMDDGNYLIPANATTLAPILPSSINEVAVFVDEEWKITTDYRGQTFYKPSNEQITIEEIGISPDDGWRLNPYPKSISEFKKDKLNEINTAFEQAMLPIIEGIPAVERESWKKQETEARAYIADSAAPTPLIDALAASRGVDKADLVSRIIVKADLFATISGQLIGKRQALEDAVNALSDKATADDVAAISW